MALCRAASFDSDDTIKQVEFAMKGAASGSTLIAAHNEICAVLLTWSPSTTYPNLEGTVINPRHHRMSKHGGIGVLGLPSDAALLSKHMFTLCNDYQYAFDEEPMFDRIVRDTGRLIHARTLSPVLRPLCARVCSIAFDPRRHMPQILETDCMGNVWPCLATCIGAWDEAFDPLNIYIICSVLILCIHVFASYFVW